MSAASLPRLNRKLLLETPVRVPDGAGGFTTSWNVLGEVFAEVRSRSGREAEGEAVPLAQVSYVITLRAAPVGSSMRPLPEQRFREGIRVFRIEAVTERGTDLRYLTCFADEELVA
ncbi:head-tail adaptor protein [Lentibacter algarum]|uniref:head-tail adaptor protein n=1 Tax=Lentibacter algarum TaxID=576131 RepID=UPI001C0A0C2D|nr:head-tail adaptor protein [Lentibacter algarum]MBU2982736.1 head-tail adaptor protein [Lentibacter algarum]